MEFYLIFRNLKLVVHYSLAWFHVGDAFQEYNAYDTKCELCQLSLYLTCCILNHCTVFDHSCIIVGKSNV